MATTEVQEETALPQDWALTPLTVVMPTYNEAGSLAGTCERVLSLPLPGLRMKVVDDNSPDGTGELAEELASRADGRISVLHRPGKEGLGRAYADGMAQAIADGARYVLQMDADGSHPADVIPRMLGVALAADCGLVVGSRYATGGSVGEDWPAHRRLLSAWANWYVARVLGLRLGDITAGFVLWRADVLPGILPQVASAGYSFQVETKYLALRSGQPAMEVPIRFAQRQAGASKMSLSVQLESALLPWRLRFRRDP
jgi:dolichol-phosphate mannosyltransferase